ncbi:MAG: SseB family protein [Thomasclavelia sp.]|nr:SseB family protein [Thomasclavelia sp.]
MYKGRKNIYQKYTNNHLTFVINKDFTIDYYNNDNLIARINQVYDINPIFNKLANLNEIEYRVKGDISGDSKSYKELTICKYMNDGPRLIDALKINNKINKFKGFVDNDFITTFGSELRDINLDDDSLMDKTLLVGASLCEDDDPYYYVMRSANGIKVKIEMNESTIYAYTSLNEFEPTKEFPFLYKTSIRKLLDMAANSDTKILLNLKNRPPLEQNRKADITNKEIDFNYLNSYIKGKRKEGEEKVPLFYMGVEDTFRLQNSNDLVVVGELYGTVCKDAAVYITNMMSDDYNEPIALSVVNGIEKHFDIVNKASNCPISLRIKDGTKYNIRKHTLLHSPQATERNLHNAYQKSLINTFIKKGDLVISVDELDKLSLTDCCELYVLANNYNSRLNSINQDKINKLYNTIIEKLLESDEINYLYDNKTGTAHMYNTVKEHGDGYFVTNPYIKIITNAYVNIMQDYFETNSIEMKTVTKGKDGKGIENFLYDLFYLDGAYGAVLNMGGIYLDKKDLVEQPNYVSKNPMDTPVTNPELVSFLLLRGQIGKPTGSYEDNIYSLYTGIILEKLADAKFLSPVRFEGEAPTGSGNITLQKDTNMKISVRKDESGNEHIPFFTDWKRLSMVFNKEWSGIVGTIGDYIDDFEIDINPTEFYLAGFRIDKDSYEVVKKIKQEKENEQLN